MRERIGSWGLEVCSYTRLLGAAKSLRDYKQGRNGGAYFVALVYSGTRSSWGLIVEQTARDFAIYVKRKTLRVLLNIDMCQWGNGRNRMETFARPKSMKAYSLRNYSLEGWEEKITGRWNYSDLVSDPTWFKGWISFDALRWNPYDKKLYCGLNSLDADLLYAFDPKTCRFECMNSQEWTDKYDVKIHRTLLLNPNDHCLYFATSLLHDLDQQHEAKGGKLVRFDPLTGTCKIMSVPVPHLYVQSIAADWERSIIYGFTYPAEALFRTDLSGNNSKILAYIGNAIMLAQPHNSIVDQDGWLWGTCAETRAWDEGIGREPIRLFKYHPDGNCFVWFNHGLARKDTKKQLLSDPRGVPAAVSALEETRHKEDFGFCDSMAYDGARYIYAGTVAGVLCRIDTQTGGVEKVANVIAAGRFPALAIKDGILYGAGGVKGQTQLIRWDMHTDQIECFADLADLEINDCPARVHEIAVDEEHQIYLGENDNHRRSSFLWVARLD